MGNDQEYSKTILCSGTKISLFQKNIFLHSLSGPSGINKFISENYKYIKCLYTFLTMVLKKQHPCNKHCCPHTVLKLLIQSYGLGDKP